ncbi:Ldh family oxidoreductase, partial [Chloroflexota bacterium]
GLVRLSPYIDGLKKGIIKAITELKVLRETPNTLLVSGGDGLGHVVGYKVMKLVIDKAIQNNIALATVRDTTHYGMAGYYPMMALKYDLIGFSVTNGGPQVVPTHGRDPMIGTNPISIAVPAGKEWPFVLDMATTTTARGRIMVKALEGKTTMPITWGTDEFGNPTQDIQKLLTNVRDGKGGGLLPLGGAEEENGGHKGYGLALAVDILSGVLSGSAFGPKITTGRSHLFGAIKIDAFIELGVFKSMMDEYINILKNSEKAVSKHRIFIPGEKEFELYEQQKEEVRILYKVVEELRKLGDEINIKVPF